MVTSSDIFGRINKKIKVRLYCTLQISMAKAALCKCAFNRGFNLRIFLKTMKSNLTSHYCE